MQGFTRLSITNKHIVTEKLYVTPDDGIICRYTYIKIRAAKRTCGAPERHFQSSIILPVNLMRHK
jgi:hypothetical protein